MVTIIRRLGAATIGAAIAAVLLLVAYEARAETNVMFIVDASGSMKKAVDGEPRMTAAKRVMAEALANMPPDTRLGLVLYGHRKAKDCTDMELAVPIGSEDSASIAKRIGALNAKGETPIAASLELAAKSFLAFKGQTNSIVLVTDGIEECKGDPCAAASAIRDAGLDLKVNIVGFTLKEEQKKLIQCVADLTGGTYYDAKDAKALSTALAAVTKKVAEPDDNILAQVNGGTLVAAPNDEWLRLNDGKEEQATTYRGEGIWAFKDGKPATFDSFDVLIPEANQYNLKDF
jgi:Ca-activated chloride channel family protein